MRAAFGKGTPESAASGAGADSAAVDIGSSRCGAEAPSTYDGAQSEATVASVIVAIRKKDHAATAAVSLAGIFLRGAQIIGYDDIVFVHAAPHLGFAAAGKHRGGSKSEKWRIDVSGTSHSVRRYAPGGGNGSLYFDAPNKGFCIEQQASVRPQMHFASAAAFWLRSA